MSSKKPSLVGAHISIAGGFYKAVERGEAVGCTAMQIFSKSNRQWHAKPITAEEATRFKKALQQSPIVEVIVHASYLINIGSPKKEVAEKSRTALIKELERCHILGISHLVLHPGARLDSDLTECLDRIVENINYVFAHTNSETSILIENMAGQGSNVCSRFEDIAYVIKKIKSKKRIGVTLDTCHAFAAGYDIATKSGYIQTFKQFDQLIGLDRLKAIHMNDSKKPLDSHVDRHEELGEGDIGIDCFKWIMQDKRFISIPKILETPDPALYEKTIRKLKKFYLGAQ